MIRYVTRWDAVGVAFALMAFLFAMTTHDWSGLTLGTLITASVGLRIWWRRLRDNETGRGRMPPPAI